MICSPLLAGHAINFKFLPDLYDTAGGGPGIGSFSLMGNCWGFANAKNFPPQLDPWSKAFVGWATVTELTTSGTYTLAPSYTTNQYYKISKNFPNGEYLLLEYRRKLGYDSYLPAEGLVIYHIDSNTDQGNEGYPGQAGWPSNGNHYMVALLAADGKYDFEMKADNGSNGGDAGDVWVNSTGGIGPYSSTNNKYPNTDAYQNGTILNTGNSITNIGPAGGDTISFTYSMCTKLSAGARCSAANQCCSNVCQSRRCQ
jgi:hypothetical protein